jgi:3-phenylpropionate/trans-cinnamate dioxygenase ferredoxin subunit
MSSDFVPVIKEDELAEGKIKQATLVGRNILLIKKDGKVYGTANRCPHMGCLLSGGKLEEYIITCPCHSWSFDIRNGQYLNNKSIVLATYECKVENGQVYVKMFDDF